jgi:hypothetical protein
METCPDKTAVIESMHKLNLTIQSQVIRYVKHCSNMNMLFVLDQFGNDEYKNDQEENLVNKWEITKYCDAVYVAKYFDLLLWWKKAGHPLQKYLVLYL